MDIDPGALFREYSDSDSEFHLEREVTKELVVYLIDASPKMFIPLNEDKEESGKTPFHLAISCVLQSLKTQIIGGSVDEVAICFLNTKEKKNLQDLSGVYVFNVMEREPLDRPSARLIKEFSNIEESFLNQIGSCYGIGTSSRENPIYNALWVAQALLRKGSSKTANKRILMFTSEDDPFGSISGPIQRDMVRTTLQRAKDAQELGISIELLPLSNPDQDFDVSKFYAELLELEGKELSQLVSSAGERIEDMQDQLRKRMFKKRTIKTLMLSIADEICIEVNTYALIRPNTPGKISWLDSVTNLPLKSERAFICEDTGALLQEPTERFFDYKGEKAKFSVDELSEVKRIGPNYLRLLGFKPLDYLKDYHNLRPSTFVFPSDEDILGSTRIFIAIHSSMIRLQRFAVAFYGSSAHPQLVALIAQEEITSCSAQVEPPGMHMIYLPYSDDIRCPEEIHANADNISSQPTDDQIKKASTLIRRIDLKNFSICQFANPALQRHYGILQAIALDEDEMPDIKDETLPDEEGMARSGVALALEDFKLAVYGKNDDQEVADFVTSTQSQASRKRKDIAYTAMQECANYNWANLADNGQLKDLTVIELKYYLTAHNLPVTGKKEVLISRILSHLGK